MTTTDLPDSAYTVMPMPERFATGDDPESTIRRCLWLYPTLFQSRTDVLVHLWLHYGNGFEWDEETGDLYSIGDDRDDKPSEEVYPPSPRLEALDIDDGTARLRAERDAEYASVRRDIDQAARTHARPRDRMSRGTYSRTYSYLWNLPEYANPAWCAAWHEAVLVLQPLVDEVEGLVERLAPRRAALIEERKRVEARLHEIDRELREMP